MSRQRLIGVEPVRLREAYLRNPGDRRFAARERRHAADPSMIGDPLPQSLCGRVVIVLERLAFDPDHADACAACAEGARRIADA